MTQTATAPADPFATPSGDPFGQPAAGGGTYPKPQDLIGELVMLTPEKIETVADNFNKGNMVDRLTADTVVLSGDRAGESFDSMWWNQTSVVKAGAAALRKNQRMILGRLRRFPISEDVKAGKFNRGDWQAIETALANWTPKSPAVRFAVALDLFTDEDAAVARAYLAKNVSPV